MSESLPSGRRPSIVLSAVKALRPRQWPKNAFVFAALLFAYQFTVPEQVMQASLGFVAFCLLSSTGYLFNDLRDREADAVHPKKRLRPIASGAVPPTLAWGLIAATLIAGVAVAWMVSPSFAGVGLLYLATTLSYSLVFKHYVILDIMMLSAGFLWRAVAGAVAIQAWISPWLLLCTGFLALFIGFNKRRGELMLLEDDAQSHRKNLAEYSPALLDEFQAITTSCTVISYALYTVLASPTPLLLATLPYVLYFIFRYIYLVQRGEGGDPSATLTRDQPTLIAGVLYVLTTLAILVYAGKPPA